MRLWLSTEESASILLQPIYTKIGAAVLDGTYWVIIMMEN